MKAIQTKYLPFTYTKPARIIAKAEGVESKTFTCDALDKWRVENKLEHTTNHQAAARLLAIKHGWSTTLVSGGLPDGTWAHCFVPDVVTETVKLGKVLFDVVSCSERFDGLKNGIDASVKALNV